MEHFTLLEKITTGRGQLGIGNIRYPQFESNFFNVEDIPPVVSVSCGAYHTLIITTDSNLWSCGKNEYGQLCLGNKENQIKPQKTSFSNISKVSSGPLHSLFQNDKGEIFSCGYNQQGECGLGHFNPPQITPSLILNAPSNIVQFVCGPSQNLFLDSEGNVYSFGELPNLPSNIVQFFCGYEQSLFLDSEGNVYSVGENIVGQNYLGLGLGHIRNQNVLNKIPNIPPIKIISCVNASCYLIDFEGNLWTFGRNDQGQLGNGDKININVPKIVNTLKGIQQISYGSCGPFFRQKLSRSNICHW